MIDAASVLILRTGVLPAWIAWLGFVAAVVLLIAFLVFPIVALLVWVGAEPRVASGQRVNLPVIGPLVSQRRLGDARA